MGEIEKIVEIFTERIHFMGNLSKKLLGASVLGAAAGAAVYYFQKKKKENPDLEEEFADFQDNVKETAASAVNVAAKLKEAVEKSLDQTLTKVKEHNNDFIDEDIFEDAFEEDVDFSSSQDSQEVMEENDGETENAKEQEE